MSVSINDTEIFDISLADYYEGNCSRFEAPSWTSGSFGFAPWQDQIAIVKNVTVFSSNGTRIYHNLMTGSNVAAEFSVATLNGSVCV
jgi:hypothetical protein